jgi:peptidoglycan/LPS O-acetylase OafA/YrhL
VTYYYRLTFLPFLIYFALGVVWAGSWERVTKAAWVWAVSVALYLAVRYEAVVPKEALGPAYVPLWAAPLSYAVVWFGHKAPAFFRRVTRFGDISYGVYIWHMVFVNFLVFYSVPTRFPGSGTWVILGLMLFTSGFAAVSWHLVEKPCLRLKAFTSRPAPLP